MNLQAFALLLTTLLAGALPPEPLPKEPLRLLYDGRVIDYRGIWQLEALVAENERRSWARADNKKTPDLRTDNQRAIEIKQRSLQREAEDRYFIRGHVMQISPTGGVFVQRDVGLRFNREYARRGINNGIEAKREMIFIRNFPSDNLVDGTPIQAWAYHIGPHRFLNTFHSYSSIPGFDFGEPFTGDTNTLMSIVRLLPTGETNLPVISARPAAKSAPLR